MPFLGRKFANLRKGNFPFQGTAIYRLSIIQKMEQARCEVCFTSPHPLNPHQISIKCQDCKRTAHLFCYDPSASSHFTCDACKYKYHGCCTLCGNGGLLKRFPNGFAHPVCLFFNPAIIVADYGNLSFASAQNLESGKKAKCSYCQNASSGVFKCGSKKCPLSCHIYCALKSYQVLEGKGWRTCLPTLESQKSFKQIGENLLLRTLRTKSKFISAQLGIKKSLKTLELPIMLYCQEHSLTIVECNCREYNEQKLDWLYCDGCCRWVHWGCVKASPAERERIEASDEGYYCQECKGWQKWVKHGDQVPERLPKLQIYDFVYIHREVQQCGSNAPFQLVELAQRIPLLPGLVYGAAFLKQNLVKKLKLNIDVAKLKSELQFADNVAKVLFDHKEELQTMQWMNSSSFVGECMELKLAHPLEETLDTDHIQEMLQALQMYQAKFCPAFSNHQLKKYMSKKASQPQIDADQQKSKTPAKQEKSKTPARQEKSKTRAKQEKSDRRTRSSSSKTAHQSFLKIQMPFPDPKAKSESVNFQEINEYLEDLHQRFKNRSYRVDLVDLYQEIFKKLKKPKIIAILNERPKNLFTRALLMETPKHAADYASFIGKMEQICQDIKILKNQDRQRPSLKSYRNLERAMSSWKKLKDIAFSSQQFSHMKLILFQQFKNRQGGGEMRECLLQISAPNDRQNQDQNSLLWTTDLKRVERELLIKQNEGLYCEEIYLLRQVLQHLKSLEFNRSSQENVAKQIKLLEMKGKAMQNLVYFYKQYMQLFQSAQQLVCALRLQKQNAQLCYFHLLAQQHPLKSFDKAAQLDSVIAFFSKIKVVRLNLFSKSIQQAIISLFKAMAERFSETGFGKEQQLLELSHWSKSLKVTLPGQLDKVIRLDITLNQRYVFQQLVFQKPQEIAKLKAKLEQDLPKYQQLKLAFRTKKITALLGWIRLYEHMLQNATNPSVLLQQLPKGQNYKKIKFEEILAYDKALGVACFPQCKFRENIRELAKSARQIKAKFDKIMNCCNWQFMYGRSQPNWQSKIDCAQVMEFMASAQRLPISLEVQLLESQIIVDKFNKNSELATKILLKVTNLPIFSISEQSLKVVRRLVNHFGATPIKCQLAQQLFHILKNAQNPNKHNKMVQKVYQKIVNSPEFFEYEEVSYLIQFMERHYHGNLDKSKALTFLKSNVAIIEECLSQFKDLFDSYSSQQAIVTQAQLKKLDCLANKFKKSSIQHPKISGMLREFTDYQFLARFLTHFEQEDYGPVLHTPMQKAIRMKTKVEALRPYFQNEKMQNLKQYLQKQLQKKGKS